MEGVTANGYRLLGTRYWNANGFATAIVAIDGEGGDWAAYIGGADPWDEREAYAFVAATGCKLSEDEARFFFPTIEKPYRR